MPSQKKKKNAKPESKTTVPVSIKSEPLDIKPLGGYVDDRVELIRQAFMCLKPREVKALVPDFMTGKSIESIQEQCLDEVLGISTKRLHSIINSMRCPTDTESSSDEEAQLQQEHISLDEISSDSEVEINQPMKKVKSKEARKTKIKDHTNVTSTSTTSTKNGNKKNEKEMTVLEILELQARARAIRSQLALEPVTKIELDSDQENVSGTEAELLKNSKSSNKIVIANTEASTSVRSSPTTEQPKRVRLKRNFRIRQVGDEEPPEVPEQQVVLQDQIEKRKTRSESREKEVKLKPVESVDSPDEKEIKVNKSKSRDSSPEVIPVIPSPETLFISSDSEEEKNQRKKLSIFVDNVEELDRQSKIGKSYGMQKNTTEPVENEEPEEGEITADELPALKKQDPIKKRFHESIDQNEKSKDNDEILITSLEQMEEELDYEIKEVSDSEPESHVQGNDLSKTFADADQSKQEMIIDKPSADEKCNDSENDSTNTSSGTEQDDCSRDDEDDPDIVEIHDSSDETLLEQKMAEDGAEKSWNSRWLESHKVAKVMAASRLGNKVRDKLKKNKKKEQEKNKQPEIPPPEPMILPTVSNAVVGSVEHYNELQQTNSASTYDRAPDGTAVTPSNDE